MKDCALQGDPDPEIQGRAKAVEAAVVALASKQTKGSVPPAAQLQSGQLCRLWNRGVCTYIPALSTLPRVQWLWQKPPADVVPHNHVAVTRDFWTSIASVTPWGHRPLHYR